MTDGVHTMMLFVVALGAGALLGLAGGGRVSRLADLRLRSPWMCWVALVTQVLLGAGGSERLTTALRGVVVVATYVLVGAWVLRNVVGVRRAMRVAMLAVAVGWALNLVPIALNGGMPVSAAAMARSGVPGDVDLADTDLAKHVPADGAVLALLGDVIPVPAFRAVVSAGDVVLGLGLATVVALGMAGDRGARRPGRPVRLAATSGVGAASAH